MKHIAMPKTIQPMQPKSCRRAFSSREWLFEPKWDGFRAICFLEKGVVRFVSRNQRSLSERFPVLQDGIQDVEALNAILDGEIVALGPNGMPLFEGLRSGRKARGCVIVFQAFDLLYLDGQSLLDETVIVRKRMLKKIVKRGARRRFCFADHILGEGERFFAEVEQSPAAINNRKWIGVLRFFGRDFLIRVDRAPRAVGEVKSTDASAFVRVKI